MLITGLDMEVATSYRVTLHSAEAGQFVFNKLSGQQLLVHLHEALASCGDDSAKLEELLDGLSTKAWSPDQKEVMRNDVWTPTLVMLYLYSRARSPDTTTSLASAALPNTGWQPLPLLAKLYPEHAPLAQHAAGYLGLGASELWGTRKPCRAGPNASLDAPFFRDVLQILLIRCYQYQRLPGRH